MLVAVGAVAFTATTAFFSDTETSKNNVFTAGAIDLGVDNESYYNNKPNPGTSWAIDWDIDQIELPDGQVLNTSRQFFNFLDLKPGDSGEDTISLHVNNNDSWLCADVTLTKNDDVNCNEPENDIEGANCPLTETTPDTDMWDGDLANRIDWYWWGDDGDNVYERCALDGQGVLINPACKDETLLPGSGSAFPNASGTFSSTVDLADANDNIWGVPGPLTGASTRFIGKAWCFGSSSFASYPQDGLGAVDDNPNTSPLNENNGPDARGVQCDGSSETNITQTDSMMMDVSFRAVQSRNNDGYECEPLAS